MRLKRYLKEILRTLYHNAPFKGLANYIGNKILINKYIKKKDIECRTAYKRAFNRLNRTLRRRSAEEIKLLEKLRIDDNGIGAYLDIGANVGQNTLSARLYFDDSIPIYSFEPSSTALAMLESLCEELPKITIYGHGVGDRNCSLPLNRSLSSPTSQASSYLDYSDLYKHEFDWARDAVTVENSEVVKLDTILSDELIGMTNIFLHIDVEGYDYFVLKGGEKTILPKTKYIIVEITFGLFEGQGTFQQIYDLLRYDFEFRGFLEPLTLSSKGESMYQDALFVRMDKRKD